MSEQAQEQVLETYAAERAARQHSARSFMFEGEQFTYKPAVAAEVLVTFLERDGLSARELLTLCDHTALACLEPQSADAWTAIRSADHQPPLDFASVIWLADQIVTRASGLPTVGPADSSAGPPAATATTSTDESGSPAVIPSI